MNQKNLHTRKLSLERQCFDDKSDFSFTIGDIITYIQNRAQERNEPLDYQKYSNNRQTTSPIKVKALSYEYLAVCYSAYIEVRHEVFFLQNNTNQKFILTIFQVQRDQVLKNLEKFRKKMLASLAHEMRTPLSSQMGLLMQLQKVENMPQSVKQELIFPIQCLNELQRSLIDDIVDYNHIELKTFSLSLTNFSLKELISNCISLFEIPLKMKRISMATYFDQSVGDLVRSDKRRVRQLLICLLNNALKFTNDGTITISTVFHQQNLVQVSVKDTGVGMADEQIQRIRVNFNTVSQDQLFIDDQDQRGAGLGLTIAAKISSALSGNKPMEVNSE